MFRCFLKLFILYNYIFYTLFYLIFSTFFLGDFNNRDKTTLLEFPVTPSTECSRVSSRSYVFTLDTDSLLLTFDNETGKLIIFLVVVFMNPCFII
jgi:hypothetical protein